jgi:hypothetical protein
MYVAVQAGPTDYLSRVAWLAGIPLNQFMLDNTGIVKDLDTPLTGLRLLLCKPKPSRATPRATPSIRWGSMMLN